MSKHRFKTEQEKLSALASSFSHLSQLAVTGDTSAARKYIEYNLETYEEISPDLSKRLKRLILAGQATGRLGTAVAEPGVVDLPDKVYMPVDRDSRMSLLRVDSLPEVSPEPVWNDKVKKILEQIIKERTTRDRLKMLGLLPSRTIMFVGPPGVGKTLAARWLARNLELPLMTLELSAIMSSYLGRTGTNLHQAFEHARTHRCVLFLDELDAIGKLRGDATEIGELKRLVTVLLQELDAWSSDTLIIAATNHPALIDPALWRRFELRIDFPMPSLEDTQQLISSVLPANPIDNKFLVSVLAALFQGNSHSTVISETRNLLRRAVLGDKGWKEELETSILPSQYQLLPKQLKYAAIGQMSKFGFSQYEIENLTGVSRPTIRKIIKGEKE